MEVDVAIIGAGVVGCSVAAALSGDVLSVVVLEQHHDVAEETSKSNTGVADSGWECVPGSLEAELIRRSSPRWEELSERLDVPFRRCGGISVARTPKDIDRLDEILGAAEGNGVKVRRLDQAEVRATAPYLTEQALAAVEIPEEGVIDSIRLTLGYAELAARNGVKFRCNEPVVGVIRSGRRVRELLTPTLRIRPQFVINAAGLGADGVSRLLGAEEFEIWPRRGEYLLVDREVGRAIGKVVTRLPTERTRGVMVVPTTHGSVLLGPTAEDDEDKTDRSTHQEILDRVLRECQGLVPALDSAHVMKSFAGLRPASERTYRIEHSTQVENVIQASGIRSTGISASPAIGEYVRELLVDSGLKARPQPDVVDRIPRLPRLSEGWDYEDLARDPLGRTVVCSCEKVTALEIHNAFRGAVPARSLAGVAKRTRATWGRCQGSACLSGVTFIASLYLRAEAWQLPFGEPAASLGVAGVADG